MPNYPVSQKFTVPRRQNFFERMQTTLKGIPAERGHYTAVMEFHGNHVIVPDGVALLDVDGIRSASGVVFVNMRAEQIVTEVSLLCRGRLSERPVRCGYRVRVVSAAEAARSDISDFEQRMAAWTGDTLGAISRQFGAREADGFDNAARAHIAQCLRESPPVGNSLLRIEVSDVQSSVPAEELEHDREAHEQRRRFERESNAARAQHELRQLKAGQIHKEELQSDNHDADRWRQSSEFRAAKDNELETKASRLERAALRGPEALAGWLAVNEPKMLADIYSNSLNYRDKQLAIWAQTVIDADLTEASKHELIKMLSNGIGAVDGDSDGPDELRSATSRGILNEDSGPADASRGGLIDIDDQSIDDQVLTTEDTADADRQRTDEDPVSSSEEAASGQENPGADSQATE